MGRRGSLVAILVCAVVQLCSKSGLRQTEAGKLAKLFPVDKLLGSE